MYKIIKILFSILIVITTSTVASSKENFFDEALKKYQNEKYEEAKFIFERNIVYNPKDAKTYLYLAKIYNHQNDQRKEEHNLETALLIDPSNEEALLMSIKIALKKFGSKIVLNFY